MLRKILAVMACVILFGCEHDEKYTIEVEDGGEVAQLAVECESQWLCPTSGSLSYFIKEVLQPYPKRYAPISSLDGWTIEFCDGEIEELSHIKLPNPHKEGELEQASKFVLGHTNSYIRKIYINGDYICRDETAPQTLCKEVLGHELYLAVERENFGLEPSERSLVKLREELLK